MKISALNSLSSTLTADAQANSYLIINNAADSSITPVTYKVSLTHAGQALSNNLKLVNYDATNQELKAYSISDNAYANATIGHYLSAEQVTKLGAISAEANKTDVIYNTSSHIIQKIIDNVTTDIVSASTLKTDMALNNVDNTSDVNKPISTATQGALDLKANLTDLTINNISGLGTVASKNVAASGNAATTEVVMGNDTRLTDARSAADVSTWAKAASKPTYTAAEVGALPDTTTIPTKVSDLQNDAGYLTTHQDISGKANIVEPIFTNSITIGSTTLTEAQLIALLALLEQGE